MMRKTVLTACGRVATGLLLVVSAVCCEQRGTLNGSQLPGFSNPKQETYHATSLVAYNEKTPRINSSGPGFVKTIGVMKSPIFGLVRASFATQLTLPEPDLYFGKNPKLDSVVFTAPLLTEDKGKDEDKNPYDNNSIVVRQSDGSFKPFIVKVYEIQSEMVSADQYYSDHEYKIGQQIGQARYTPSQDSTETKVGDDTKKLPPAFSIRLDESNTAYRDYFQHAFLDAKGSHFVNDADFRNYFKGLYLTAATVDGDGSLVGFDGNAGALLLYYRNDSATGLIKAFSIGSTASQLGVYAYSFTGASAELKAQLDQPNKTQGEDKLFIAGLGGPKAVVRLFSDADFQALEAKDVAINQALLVVHATAAQTPLPTSLALLSEETKKPIPGGSALLNPKDNTYTFDIASYLNQRLRNANTVDLLDLVAAKVITTPDGEVISQNTPLQAILDGKAGEKPLSLDISYTTLVD